MSNLATVQTTQTDTELMQQYLREILLSPVYQAAVETPLDAMAKLSQRLDHNVLLKREDKQPVYSFKLRGAFHKLHKVQQQNPDARVVCASAGNHAQGVALSASKLGLNATIVMPITTPEIKVAAVKALGGNVVLHGTAFDEANSYAINLANTEGAIYIPPFDDFDIIAGQATVTLEILAAQVPDFLFVAIGGGGLAAGAALVLPASTSLIGVEPAGAPSMQQSLAASEVVVLPEIDRFVDGASVKQVGLKTFSICQQGLSRMLTVSKKDLCQTMLDLYALKSMIVEPAGALSVAGLAQMADEIKGKTVVCVISGGNFDPKRFPEIKLLASS